MQFPGFAALIGLSVTVFGTLSASADQCPQDKSPIATDRPDVANSSLVVPQGSFQYENGIDLSRRAEGYAFEASESRLRFGVGPCVEILVDVPAYIAARSGPAGFTDLAAAVKWQVSPVPGKIDLSATFGAGFPTGAKAVAGPGIQPYVQFPWSWNLGRGWSITGMLTNSLVPAVPGSALSTETTFGLEREAGENAFVFVEYVGDYHIHGSPSYLLNSGAGYRITPTQQIDFHVGVGLNSSAPAFVFGIGYSFRRDRLF